MRGDGGGRPRKPDDQRRNRMPSTRNTVTIPANARVARIPAPSLPFDGIRLKIWRQMWRQPLATLWDRADVAALTRLVVLQTTASAYQSHLLLAEMRQLEDRFLLNPYARAQQRVVLAEAEDESGEAASDVTSLDEYRAALDI